jgi:hypothetical protein
MATVAPPASRVAFVILLIALVFTVIGATGFDTSTEKPNGYVPYCDDKPMQPGDSCTTFDSTGGETVTYDQMVARHYSNKRVLITLFIVGASVAFLSAVLLVVSETRARRR